jgi:hypothetical protein
LASALPHISTTWCLSTPRRRRVQDACTPRMIRPNDPFLPWHSYLSGRACGSPRFICGTLRGSTRYRSNSSTFHRCDRNQCGTDLLIGALTALSFAEATGTFREKRLDSCSVVEPRSRATYSRGENAFGIHNPHLFATREASNLLGGAGFLTSKLGRIT